MLLLRLVCATLVLTLSFGVAMAEQFAGVIRKIDGDKITIVKFGKKGSGKKGKEATFTLAKKVKVVNAKYNKEEKKFETGEALKDGLKNERFKDLKEKPVAARFITNDDGKVTDIQVFPPFNFKKKPKKDD